MTVLWSDTAIKHLLGIFEYTSQTSQVYAERIIDRLTSRSEQIADFPGSGHKVPEYDDDRIREVIEPSYRVIIVSKEIEWTYWPWYILRILFRPANQNKLGHLQIIKTAPRAFAMLSRTLPDPRTSSREEFHPR